MREKNELSEETKRNIAQAREEIKAGGFYTHKQVKKILGLVIYKKRALKILDKNP